jgi:hypothetical protein
VTGNELLRKLRRLAKRRGIRSGSIQPAARAGMA